MPDRCNASLRGRLLRRWLLLGGVGGVWSHGVVTVSVYDNIGTSIGVGTGAAGAATAGAAAGTTAASVGLASTIVGLAAVPVLLLLGKLFHGADPRQVPASKIQQVFEAAAHNLLAVGRAGMISRAEVVDGARLFARKGLEFYNSPDVVLGQAEERGRARMQVNINEVIIAAQGGAVPAPASDDYLQPAPGGPVAESRAGPLDLAAARRVYIPVSKAGWYRESLEAATNLTDSYLAELPKNIMEKAVSALGLSPASLAAPVSASFPLPWWVVILGVGVGAVALGRVS